MQCEICGRKLKSQKSIERGIGPGCWAKEHPTDKAERKLCATKAGKGSVPAEIEQIPGQMHIADFI